MPILVTFSGITIDVKSIIVPESVTSIEIAAFGGCSSLEEIVLPFVGNKLDTTVDGYRTAFGYIFGKEWYENSIETFQVYYKYYEEDMMVHQAYYIPKLLKKVTINGGKILNGSFYDCANLSEVTLGNNVTIIDTNAFANCRGLEIINIPLSVEIINKRAFIGTDIVTINCEALSKPDGWAEDWCYSSEVINWGVK